MTGTFTLFVPGKPQAQGSKTKGRWGGIREDNKELGPWRERVALVAHDRGNGEPVLTVAISMRLDFIMRRPVATPKRRTPPAVKKPDLDKCTRAIFDALTSIVYHDDSQVTYLVATKRLAEIGEEPGVEIHVSWEEL